MEEIDLCWRLLARGGKIVAMPASVVYHVGGATLQKSNPRKTYLNFRNNLLLLYKNMPGCKLRRVLCVRCLLDYVAALKFLLTGNWGDFRAVVRARRDFKHMKSEFALSRAENMAKTVVAEPEGLFSFSLLWQYFFKRRRTFLLLPKNNDK